MLEKTNWVLAGIMMLGLGLLWTCDEPSGPEPLTNEDFLAWGTYGAGVTTYTFVDETRETPATENYPGAPDRTLVVEVYYPIDNSSSQAPQADVPPTAVGGPFPLIVFSHGFMGNRHNNGQEATLLASHGYVVAAIDFPLTKMSAPGGADFNDVINQPADVSFVIDELLAENATPGALLSGTMDETRIALQGHSLGAYTSAFVGFHPDLRDPRVGAAILLAGAACRLPQRTFEPPNVPLLILHGDRDAMTNYEQSAPPLFAAASAPKWLVTFVEGTHTGFVDATAEVFAGLSHADSVGCDVMGTIDASDIDPAFIAWLESLGGELIGEECGLPCEDPTIYDYGMNTLRQVELLFVSVRAFLDGLFKGDQRALNFLGRGFPAQNEDILVEQLSE